MIEAGLSKFEVKVKIEVHKRKQMGSLSKDNNHFFWDNFYHFFHFFESSNDSSEGIVICHQYSNSDVKAMFMLIWNYLVTGNKDTCWWCCLLFSFASRCHGCIPWFHLCITSRKWLLDVAFTEYHRTPHIFDPSVSRGLDAGAYNIRNTNTKHADRVIHEVVYPNA